MGKIGKFTKIISKIHGSRTKKKDQSRFKGKIRDSIDGSKIIKYPFTNYSENKGNKFTVQEENKTQFTVHSKNKSPITVHGNTSLRPNLVYRILHPARLPVDPKAVYHHNSYL